jgi:uncharacterized membrane protein
MTHGMSTPIEIASAPPHQGWAPPRWAAPSGLFLALGGLGVSTYLTIAHYGVSVTLACPDSGAINCEKVTTSPESVIAGMPVAVLGLVFFGSMVLMDLPCTWSSPSPVVRGTRLGLSALGVAFAVYHIYTELVTLHAICLWCTSARVMAFLLFAVVLFAESLGRPFTTER